MFRWKKSWVFFRVCAPCKRAGCRRANPACPTGHCRKGFWLGFYDRDGVQRHQCYPTEKARGSAARHVDEQLNSWLAPPASKPWGDLLAEYDGVQAANAPGSRDKVDAVLALFTHNVRPTWTHAVSASQVREYLVKRLSGGLTRPVDVGRGMADGGGTSHIPPPTSHIAVKPVSKATAHGDWLILHGLFEFAVANRYAPANPLKQVPAPSLPRRIKPQPSDKQWVALLEVLERPDVELDDPQAWHLLILLGVVTGLRQSVLLSLRLCDPGKAERAALERSRRPWAWLKLGDADNEHVGLIHSYTQKTEKEKLCGLPAVVNDRLASRVASLPDQARFVFPWKRWQRKAWERINRTAAVRFAFQALRGTSATRSSIAEAQRHAAAHLGHSSPHVTRAHYLDQEALVRAEAAGQRLPALPPLPAFRAPPAPDKGRRLPLYNE